MSWQQWVIVSYLTVTALAQVTIIGQPKKPTTPGNAVTGLITVGILIALTITIK